VAKPEPFPNLWGETRVFPSTVTSRPLNGVSPPPLPFSENPAVGAFFPKLGSPGKSGNGKCLAYYPRDKKNFAPRLVGTLFGGFGRPRAQVGGPIPQPPWRKGKTPIALEAVESGLGFFRPLRPRASRDEPLARVGFLSTPPTGLLDQSRGNFESAFFPNCPPSGDSPIFQNTIPPTDRKWQTQIFHCRPPLRQPKLSPQPLFPSGENFFSFGSSKIGWGPPPLRPPLSLTVFDSSPVVTWEPPNRGFPLP